MIMKMHNFQNHEDFVQVINFVSFYNGFEQS